jgi:hypothetical protein
MTRNHAHYKKKKGKQKKMIFMCYYYIEIEIGIVNIFDVFLFSFFHLAIYLSVYLSICFCGSRDGIHSLVHARQVLYHWAIPPAPWYISLQSHICTKFNMSGLISYYMWICSFLCLNGPLTFPHFCLSQCHYVAQADLELEIVLPRKCWDHRCAPPCQAHLPFVNLQWLYFVISMFPHFKVFPIFYCC